MKRMEESSLWLITYSYNVGVPREHFLLLYFWGAQSFIRRTTNQNS